MARHFAEAFPELPIIEITHFSYSPRSRWDPKARLRIIMPAGYDEKTDHNYNTTDWAKMKQWVQTRIRTWFKKNTPYTLEKSQRNNAWFNDKSPTGYSIAQDLYLHDK